MTLLAQDKRTILVALRIRSKRFYLDYMSQGEVRTVNVKDDRFADGNWHTVVVTVSRRMAKFTIDCAEPIKRELLVPFPKRMNIRNTRIFVASRRKKTKQFTGLLRQLVLFSGSDATTRICPSTNPPFGAPGTPAGQGVLFESDKQKIDCSLDQRGTLMYKEDKSMEVCTGTTFQQVRGGRERMDYVIDYDDINFENATVSMEWFKIDGVGLFLATAGGAGGSSQIMKWDGTRFNPFQNIPINNVMHWNFFQIGYDNYLAASVLSSNCIIFRWARRRRKFVLSQRLVVVNARNSEFFSQDGRHFLAVADYGQEGGFVSNPRSVIFEFRDGRFEVFQYLETKGAVDVTFFSVENSVFCLVFASAYHQDSFVVPSPIFCAFSPTLKFDNYQDIVTYGATDWEFFKINDRYFLVVANAVNSTQPIRREDKVNSTDSVIYELNLFQRQFHVYQKISTQNAYDWEFFTIGAQYFLAVTSTFAIDDGTPNVKIYRWKGYEKFVLEHTLPFGSALDIDYIPINGDHYLAVSNPKTSASSDYRSKDPLGSKLYKIVTY
uniref:Thrombospondin-type laminin G domain and EAR repeat-containing protein-like n=1 Tax=Phallusia mammillata TaxID=59560 RepID=A0A6F9DVZ8_9ASCI|nr:thrombospondin-type laminin G domain and EAR repeat-containing protein-like [Phallusia mammillata]